MRKVIYLILLLILANSCRSQESSIFNESIINWDEYDKIYTNDSKSQLKKEYEFLKDIRLSTFYYWSDGLKIQAFLAQPKKIGKYPVIIYNGGGNRDYGALTHKRQKYRNMISFNFSSLAKEGYVVLGCNVRGRGNSQGKDQFGGDDLNDILKLFDIIKNIPNADIGNIGMYGVSRGGMMTYLTLAHSKLVKAAVVLGGNSDLTTIYRPEMEEKVYSELMPNYWQNKQIELEKRSGICLSKDFSPHTPILLLHGGNDLRVNPKNSLRMAIELQNNDIPYRLKIYEKAGHSIREYKREVDKEIISWFNRYLK